MLVAPVLEIILVWVLTRKVTARATFFTLTYYVSALIRFLLNSNLELTIERELRFCCTDAPRCRPNQMRVHGIAKAEKATISCSVEANPPEVSFRWLFNNSAESIDVASSHITKSGTVSMVSYTPRTEMDYGTLLCWARNSIGDQKVPCVFHIIAAGECRVVSKTITAHLGYVNYSGNCSQVDPIQLSTVPSEMFQ